MDLIFNEKTQMWEEKKEPFAVIEIETEDNFNRIKELWKADREGRCVVLPCKVGDAIYMPTGIRHCKITGYEEDECDGFHIASDGVLQIKAKCWTGNHGTYGVPSKTVFLTREEAEAALREAEG